MEPAPLGTGHVPVPRAGGRGLPGHHRGRRPAAGDPLSADLDLATRVAREAGALLLSRVGREARGVGVKSSATDMVSAADRDAEALIVERLREAAPDDGLLGEEGGRAEAASGRRWIVDPLDGTTNFLYRFPAWAVSVALEDGEGMAVGVVFDPARDELFSAVRGAGAWLNGERLRAQAPPGLGTALLGTGFGYDAERRALQGSVVARLLPRVRDIRRAGAAALDIAWVAAGRLDAYYERGVNLWDWAAARLIGSEAGIAVADLEREPHGLAAAHPDLLPALLDAIREAESGLF